MREDAKQQGEQLTPYSFRHRYAKEMHGNKISIANISEAMGHHTIEVHLISCARFSSNPTRRQTSWQRSTSNLLSRLH